MAAGRRTARSSSTASHAVLLLPRVGILGFTSSRNLVMAASGLVLVLMFHLSLHSKARQTLPLNRVHHHSLQSGKLSSNAVCQKLRLHEIISGDSALFMIFLFMCFIFSGKGDRERQPQLLLKLRLCGSTAYHVPAPPYSPPPSVAAAATHLVLLLLPVLTVLLVLGHCVHGVDHSSSRQHQRTQGGLRGLQVFRDNESDRQQVAKGKTMGLQTLSPSPVHSNKPVLQ